MENSELCIKMLAIQEPDSAGLAGFPFLPGQESVGEEDDETEQTMTWFIIDLGDRTDTTAAQEQFLNTNPNVLEWTIR